MTKPVSVKVPAPSGAFPTIHFTLYRPEDAGKRIKVLRGHIAELETSDDLTPGLLLKAMHWHHAVDALLDGLLELRRREADGLIELWWAESYPCTVPPPWPHDEEPSEGVAAA